MHEHIVCAWYHSAIACVNLFLLGSYSLPIKVWYHSPISERYLFIYQIISNVPLFSDCMGTPQCSYVIGKLPQLRLGPIPAINKEYTYWFFAGCTNRNCEKPFDQYCEEMPTKTVAMKVMNRAVGPHITKTARNNELVRQVLVI